MAGIFDILPGYLKMPSPADTDLATYLKRITPTASKPDPWDSFNYWSNTPKFAVSFLKAMYGPAATKENDFAFQLSAQDRPQLLLGEYLERHVRGQGQGHIRLRHERRDDRPRLAEKYRRPEESRLAGGLRNLSRRDQRVLARTGHHSRRHEEDQYHGLSPAGRGFRREGWNLRKFCPLAAVEECRRAAPRASPVGSGDPGDNLSQSSRTVSRKKAASFPIRF